MYNQGEVVLGIIFNISSEFSWFGGNSRDLMDDFRGISSTFVANMAVSNDFQAKKII